MRIAFDHQTFTLQAYGGISRYFVRVIEELLIKEEEVGIFAPYHCNQLLSMLPQNVVFGKQISKNDFNKPTALALLVANQILASKKIKKWEPSIFHETYYSFKKRTHNKYVTVITVYDMIHEKFPFYFSKLDPTSFLKRDAINRADHIICISTSTKNDLLEIFPSVRDKVSVVHLGVSLFKTLNSTVSISRPYLFYVGSRNGHKNFTNFLTSFISLQHGFC